MNWILEDSTPVLAITAFAEIILIAALLRTGKGWFLYAIFIVAAVGGGCFLIDWIVETDRERVAEVVDQTRQAALTNEPDQVFLWIASDALPLRSEVARDLAQFQIRAIKITDGPHITLHRHTAPPVADVKLTARIDLKGKAATLSRSSILLRAEARARRTPEGWRWTEARLAHPLSR